MKGKAILRIQTRPYTYAIIKALLPEIKLPATKRAKASIKKKKDSIVIALEASDTTALRASINSYCRWLLGIMESLEKLEKTKEFSN